MEASGFVTEIIDKYIKDEELKRLLITHSRLVALKALSLYEGMGGAGMDTQFIYDAAMLHDIGIVKCDAPSIHCHGTLPYICHGTAGSEILKNEGLDERYRRVCERHTGAGITKEEIEVLNLPLPARDFLPETPEEKLICYADKFYSKSGDPTKEKSVEKIKNSMLRHGEGPYKRFLELESLFGVGRHKPSEE